MIILHPSALMISRNVCHEITMQYIMFKLFTSEAKQHPGLFPMYSRRFKRNHFLFNKFPLIFHNFTFCDKSNRSICGNSFTSNRLYTCQQNCIRSLSWISTSRFYNLNQIMLFNASLFRRRHLNKVRNSCKIKSIFLWISLLHWWIHIF